MARQRPTIRLAPALAAFVGLLAAIGLLQWLVGAGWISQLVLPQPSAIGAAIVRLVESGTLVDAFVFTLSELLAVLCAALIVGVPLGYALYRWPHLGEAYTDWLSAFFASPLPLLYPLFLVFFGRNVYPILVMSFLHGVIPIALHVREGLRGIPEVLLSVGHSFQTGRKAQFFKIMLPAAAPTIFVGIRLGIIYSLVSIIGLEFLIDYGGLGRLVSDMYFRFSFPDMYAAIVSIVVLSGLFFWVLNRASRWVRAL